MTNCLPVSSARWAPSSVAEAARMNFPPLIAYTDRWSTRAGGRIEVKVSCSSARYRADLVRIRSADPNPAGPGLLFDNVPADFEGSYPGRSQEIHGGSYGVLSARSTRAAARVDTLCASAALAARRSASGGFDMDRRNRAFVARDRRWGRTAGGRRRLPCRRRRCWSVDGTSCA